MPAQRWLEMAKTCEEASRLLAEAGNWRSCVSRAYYAAYCAVHAMLLTRNETSPAKGNWDHGQLGALLHSNLRTRTPRFVARGDKYYRSRFNQLRDLRIVADYGPMISVGLVDASQARQLAGPFVRLAEEIIEP